MKKLRLIICLISLILGIGCSDEKGDLPVLEVLERTFVMGHQEGQVELEINSNGAWSLMSQAVWCEVLTQHGVGPGKAKVKVRANTTEKVREGVLVLEGQELKQEITISQEALILNLDTTALTFDAGGGTKEVLVRSNTSWEVVCQVDWLHLSPVMGKDTGSFQITVDPTNTIQQRQVDVVVKSGMVRKQVRITQAAVAGEWHKEGEVRLFREEDKDNPVKLVFMGDGFIEEDMLVGGAYDQAMEEAIEAFLATEPYPAYRNYFCPYIVYAVSQEREMSTLDGEGNMKVEKKTAFGSNLKQGTTLMNADLNKIVEYAKKVPGLVTTQSSIIVSVNDKRYAGTCYHWGNGQTVSLVPMNRDLRPPGGFGHLITHEGAGHGFGRLADEYTGNGQIPDSEVQSLNKSHLAGQFLNVTTSRDPETVYWHDFIDRPGYELVGFFEGAHTYGHGVWRCENHNCMIDNIFYFSVACRLAIVKRLKSIAGEVFSLEDFIALDTQKAPTPGQLAGTRSFVPDYYPAPTSPVLVKE